MPGPEETKFEEFTQTETSPEILPRLIQCNMGPRPPTKLWSKWNPGNPLIVPDAEFVKKRVLKVSKGRSDPRNPPVDTENVLRLSNPTALICGVSSLNVIGEVLMYRGTGAALNAMSQDAATARRERVKCLIANLQQG